MTTILTINSGSSSLKASLFLADGTRRNFHYAEARKKQKEAFDQLMLDIGDDRPDVVGHRFVHGGDIADAARLVDAAERVRLKKITHLAPLHMPGNLLGLDLCTQRFKAPQIACFDTAFHATLPELSRRLPIPAEFGLRRYGFHGLNYAHVARQLPAMLGEAARGRIVVAHLGSGASLCMLQNLQSTDTSMGYTPAGGIPMATRSGDLDPGVMVELAKRCSPEQLSDLVFHKMGLLALSDGESPDMRELLEGDSEAAKFAVDYFCRETRAAIAAMAARAGDIDALAFTGGIGEHSPEVRKGICSSLAFFGFELDDIANREGQRHIGMPGSKPVLVIPADEEETIRALCMEYCSLLPA